MRVNGNQLTPNRKTISDISDCFLILEDEGSKLSFSTNDNGDVYHSPGVLYYDVDFTNYFLNFKSRFIELKHKLPRKLKKKSNYKTDLVEEFNKEFKNLFESFNYRLFCELGIICNVSFNRPKRHRVFDSYREREIYESYDFQKYDTIDKFYNKSVTRFYIKLSMINT